MLLRNIKKFVWVVGGGTESKLRDHIWPNGTILIVAGVSYAIK